MTACDPNSHLLGMKWAQRFVFKAFFRIKKGFVVAWDGSGARQGLAKKYVIVQLHWQLAEMTTSSVFLCSNHTSSRLYLFSRDCNDIFNTSSLAATTQAQPSYRPATHTPYLKLQLPTYPHNGWYALLVRTCLTACTDIIT